MTNCGHCGRPFTDGGGFAMHEKSCGTRKRLVALSQNSQRIRYGAWFTGTDWKHHQRSGVSAFATAAELLEACR